MASKSVLIRVPSTVGNFGGAVNCAALALDAPLNVKVTPRIDGHVGIRYFGENGERVPRDRSNLVVRAMEAALHLRGLEFTGADFEIYSSVPVAVGLGSSAAAILAGLIAADRLFRLELDEKTLFDLAAVYENYGDNLRAAWYGGFVARAEGGDAFGYQRTVVPENLTLSVVIPEVSFASGRVPPPRRAPAQDLSVHFRRARGFAEFFSRPETRRTPDCEEAFRPTGEKVVPGLEDALKVEASGSFAVFVCGSGPAVGILAQAEGADPASAVSSVHECFARSGTATRTAEFRPTNSGARERNAVHAEVLLPPSRGLRISLQKTTADSV